ncbi:hypothetical protein AMATHDRAFT_44973 [Amanita thiersii Skay4041]|uniref:histone acetyltransferase n=1 Tax=Amanita thiersii Skay4041 TaxID=703135 RepID=A0A2A9P0L6_9AGAR|nr:hypothetical protein AMATHDRAFT_44973 [Amanita thiersii Skay4041]
MAGIFLDSGQILRELPPGGVRANSFLGVDSTLTDTVMRFSANRLNSRESLREKAGVTRDRTFLHLSEIRNVSVSNPPEGSVTDDPKPRSRNSRHGGLTVAVHTQTITKTDFEVVDAVCGWLKSASLDNDACYNTWTTKTKIRSIAQVCIPQLLSSIVIIAFYVTRENLMTWEAGKKCTRDFHLHLLVSAPRKNSSLYIFAKPLPRVYLQDILVLLSEQSSPNAPRIIVVAIEACLYHIPATSTLVLYVSKVDTTGQGRAPSPTATLVRSLLSFYANPSTRPIPTKHFWIHLFARAQGQYLFPNSSDFPGKKPLADIKLCVWWKRILSDVAQKVQSQVNPQTQFQLFYLLPGYSEFEASNAINYAASSLTSLQHTVVWTYGHPYSQINISLPCPRNTNSNNLGHLIPSFDDDPKSRFLDDIAYTTNGDVKSPARKRARASSHHEGTDSHSSSNTKGKNDREGKSEAPLGELGKVSADEFWERMSFRQECTSGAVTGFFAVGVKTEDEESSTATYTAPLGPSAGQVSPQVIKRILTSLTTGVEFSTIERAIRATETVEGAIKGLCEGIGTLPTSVIQGLKKFPSAGEEDRRTPEVDSSVSEPPAPPCTPPPRQSSGWKVNADISPNQFPEPVTSLETYNKYIYGSISVYKPWPRGIEEEEKGEEGKRVGGVEREQQVTVLRARKKKRE